MVEIWGHFNFFCFFKNLFFNFWSFGPNYLAWRLWQVALVVPGRRERRKGWGQRRGRLDLGLVGHLKKN